eukprot:scaffold1870_cov73-Cyclotella_meneghiniana.AAC.11
MTWRLYNARLNILARIKSGRVSTNKWGATDDLMPSADNGDDDATERCRCFTMFSWYKTARVIESNTGNRRCEFLVLR